jgi:putative DNA methylase
MTIKSPKKLIEVALPLDAINVASAREKSIRHGHPSTLHLWWARRPLAAARAVIFAQLVTIPDLWRCQNPGKEPNAQVKGHWTKARAAVHDHRRPGQVGKHDQRTGAGAAARRDPPSWRESCELNGPSAGKPNCSTRTSCPPCTIPLPAAAPSRWKPSGWDWKPTPATSTPWPC